MTNIPLVRRRQAAPARWPFSRRQTVIGVAPLIVSLAPCAVMCGLGVCVMCKSKGCDAEKTPADMPDTTRD